MSSTWGKNLKISLFGESHGPYVGITIHGFPSGIKIDEEFILNQMYRRQGGNSKIVTQRRERDIPEIISGVLNNRTCGTPITAIIKNQNTVHSDYDNIHSIPRPSHSDYTGSIRYKNFNDRRGGGHFSGRLTAPITFAGALCELYLMQFDISILSHILSIKNLTDTSLADFNGINDDIIKLKNSTMPVINEDMRCEMETLIGSVKNDEDSVGGIIECGIFGLRAGVGNPFFDTIESSIASILFSIPAVKGVSFGMGFDITELLGSQANDKFSVENGVVKTITNNNGGVLGGISNGMPITFKVAIKPTSSIGKSQNTLNVNTMLQDELKVSGRHDPCIALRAPVVIESSAAISVMDMLIGASAYE